MAGNCQSTDKQYLYRSMHLAVQKYIFSVDWLYTMHGLCKHLTRALRYTSKSLYVHFFDVDFGDKGWLFMQNLVTGWGSGKREMRKCLKAIQTWHRTLALYPGPLPSLAVLYTEKQAFQCAALQSWE